MSDQRRTRHDRSNRADPLRVRVPDEAEYPYGVGSLGRDQAVRIGGVIDDSHAPAFDLAVDNDEKTGIYEAIVGDAKVVGLPSNVAGDDRPVLLATSVFAEFRGHGIATELTRNVLDNVRAQGKTVIHHVSDRAHLHRVQRRVRRPHRP
ncbi:N-acetyltransferase [Nocardia sp. NPDC049220]|uniref:N-acetyltransferase n=1 Tax=Nocardia sp. NPDC049220 TaxID=3155273 RepID=UPI003403F5FB